MRTRSCTCGYRHRVRPLTGDKKPLTVTELMAPRNLVALVTRRPDLVGIGVGARLAEATREGA